MSRLAYSFGRTGIACLVFAGLLPGASAAEERPDPSAPADAISAAKRDFETIKAARDSALQQKGELPRLSVPDLQTSAPSILPSRGEADREKDARLKQKSANWLIEAMEKKPAGRRDQGRNSADLADEIHLLPGSQTDMDAAERTGGGVTPHAQLEKGSRAAEAPPPNPLNPFLAGWMTPQDYALLKPELQSPGAGVVARAGDAPASPPVSTVSITLQSDLAGTLKSSGRAEFNRAQPAGNPYLQSINEPTAVVQVSPAPRTAPSKTPPGSASVIFMPLSTPAPAQPKKIPDFAKPATDDKYFKPLKRF